MGKVKILLLLLFLLLGYFLWQFYSLAKYFSKKERLNVLVYDSQPVFLSLDLRDGINYYSYLPLDYKIEVPGGYENYRVGSLGKLAFLEKEPDLLKRSFSLLFATPVDYYFYSDLLKVYYKEEKGGSRGKGKAFLTLKKLFVYKTNASFPEKLFIWSRFLTASSASFEPIKIRWEEVEKSRVNLGKFHKRIQGNFYNRKIREENKRLEIYYNKNYSAAENLAAVFEGMGVDVLSFNREGKKGGCEVKSKGKGATQEIISRFFGCRAVYDSRLEEDLIKFYTGEKLEEKWR